MKIKSRHINDFQVPSTCEKRLYLRTYTYAHIERSDFEKLLLELSKEHEKTFKNQHKNIIDLSKGTEEDRIKKTKEMFKKGRNVILYKPLIEYKLDDERELVAEPSFVIIDNNKNIQVVETKLVTSIDRHIEIPLNLYFTSFVMRKALNKETKLSVFTANDEIIDVPEISYNEEEEIVDDVTRIIHNILSNNEVPYSPVRLSKCKDCCYSNYCMVKAFEEKEASTVYGVYDNVARVLNKINVTNANRIVKFGLKNLANIDFVYGNRIQKLGMKRAAKIYHHAKAMTSGKVLLHPEGVLKHMGKLKELMKSNVQVMFDLEGIPKNIDGRIERIYLWGLKTISKNGRKHNYSVFSDTKLTLKADKETWEEFLNSVEKIFKHHGDVPFLHWSPYEKVKLDLYVKRYPSKRAKKLVERIKRNLVDLLPVIRDTIISPLPGGYGIKIIEQLADYKREVKGMGDWSISMFYDIIKFKKEGKKEAAEKKLKLLKEYNDDDLESQFKIENWFFKDFGEKIADTLLKGRMKLDAETKEFLNDMKKYSKSLKKEFEPSII